MSETRCSLPLETKNMGLVHCRDILTNFFNITTDTCRYYYNKRVSVEILEVSLEIWSISCDVVGGWDSNWVGHPHQGKLPLIPRWSATLFSITTDTSLSYYNTRVSIEKLKVSLPIQGIFCDVGGGWDLK